MMRFTCLFLAFAGFCTPSWAEPVLILSGEHDGYSRLVIPMNGATDWSVTQKGKTVALRYQDFDTGFDTSNIFERIQRDRISDVQPEKSSLTVRLNCDCTVSAFLERNAYVVIDIASPGVRLPTPLITPEDPDVDMATKAPTLPMLNGSGPPTPPPVPIDLSRETLTSEARHVLTNMEQRLTEELGSATTLGILRPIRPQSNQPITRQRPPTLETTPILIAPLPLPDTAFSNLRVTSSQDVVQRRRHRQSAVSPDGIQCPSPGLYDATGWGDMRSFAAQISEARKGLFSELDRLDPKVALRLAKSYLYFGFGAEARQVLKLDPSLMDQNGYLLEIANLFDPVPTSQTQTLATFSNCETEMALWALVSSPDNIIPFQPAIDEALRNLNSLPVHLRNILAPMLSRKLLALSQPDAAAAALRSLTRLPREMPAAGKLAEAKGALEAGKFRDSKAELERLIEQNTADSPEALITWVNAQVEANQPVPADIAELVSAYAKELKNTSLGPEMLRMHVIALSKSGQFDAAFDALEQLGKESNTKPLKGLRKILLRDVVNAASDIDFLYHALDQRGQDIARLPPEDILRLAERFLELGFPLQADNALTQIPDNAVLDRSKLLAARIALTLDKPFRALADLLGVEGEEAAELRLDANRIAGANDNAQRPYRQLSELNSALDVVAAPDEGQRFTSPDANNFSTTAARVSANVAKGRDGMLARTENLLTESTQAREKIEALLAADRLDDEISN